MTEDDCLRIGDPSEPVRPLRIASRFLMSMAGVVLLTACTAAPQARYADVAATVAPLSADRGRLYFYRDYELYESLARPYIYLNNQPSAISEPGGVLYRDVPAGAYVIAVDSYSRGYPARAKTVAVKGGEIYYIKVESLRSWASGGGVNDYERDTFVAVLVDPEQARQEIPDLAFFRGP